MKARDAYTTKELKSLLGLKSASSIIRRAGKEGWEHRVRATDKQGRPSHEWMIASMPVATRDAIAVAMLTEGPAADTPVLPGTSALASPVAAAPPVPASSLANLTEHQRETALARLAFVREIERAAAVVGKEKAIRGILNAAKDGTLAPRLASLIRVANDRYGDGTAHPVGLSRRRLYDWCARFGTNGERGLAPTRKGRDMSVPAWAPVFLALWQVPMKPSIADAYRQFAQTYTGKLPSIFAVRRWLEKMSMPAREYGRRTGNAMLKLRPHKRRSTDELWPTDIYTADGTTFDAEIRHPIHGQPFKPEVTLFIDVATRRCVGLSLGLAESGYVILDALRMACLFGGIPAMLYTDNGSGYCNQMMAAAGSGMMDRLGITMTHSIPGRPQGKGLMERAVQTICEPVSKRFVTCSHADMDGDAAKKVFHITRKEIDTYGQSRLMPSWDEFKAAMLARIDEYNASPHRGLPKVEDQATGKRRHLTPDEAWQGFVQRGWEPVRVPDEIKSELFMPSLPRQVRNGEVHIFTHIYYADELADFHMQYVHVRYDIWDASRVYCWTTSGEQICTAMLDGNSIPYQPKSQMDAALEKRKAGQLSRAGKKINAISPGATIQLADSLTHQPGQVVLDVPAEPAVEPAGPAKRPFFTTVQERYAWLMRNRDRWTGKDDAWMADYVRSAHYADLHDYYKYEGIAWDASVQANAQ